MTYSNSQIVSRGLRARDFWCLAELCEALLERRQSLQADFSRSSVRSTPDDKKVHADEKKADAGVDRWHAGLSIE